MTDIAYHIRLEIVALDKAARLAAGDINGVSSGPKGSVVHLPENTAGVIQAKVEAMLTAYGTLAVNVSPDSIPADDITEATITLNTVDAEIDWLLVDAADEAVLGSGTEAAVAGVVSLTFKTGAAGIYDIWLFRKTGDFATGKVRVTVTEV